MTSQTLDRVVDPPFCLPSTCPIRYLFSTLQQFPGGPLLLVQPIFSKPPQGLWLRDLSNFIVTLDSPNLDFGTLGPFRYTWPVRYHLRPTQTFLAHYAPPQAHLGSLRSTQAYLAYQAPTHLGSLGQFFNLSALRFVFLSSICFKWVLVYLFIYLFFYFLGNYMILMLCFFIT